MARDKSDGKNDKPESQQRGKTSGPDLSKVKPISKEKMDKILDEWKKDIDEG